MPNQTFFTEIIELRKRRDDLLNANTEYAGKNRSLENELELARDAIRSRDKVLDICGNHLTNLEEQLGELKKRNANLMKELAAREGAAKC